MTFVQVRRLAFQVHMWVGLILGILLALLGLSGSMLVYDDAIANVLDPPPRVEAQGAPLPLDRIAAVARQAAGRGTMQISLPVVAGEPVMVRVGQISRMGPMPQQGAAPRAGRHRRAEGGEGPPRGRGTQLFIDPVSGKVLATRHAMLPPILIFAHQLHGNFLMGRQGRVFVGWLGVAMVVLGVTGLLLWWPRRGQWKYAFFVRRTARGVRFHRELHAATGIWIFIVFMAVSISGVAIAFPGLMGGGARQPGFNFREGPAVEPVEGASALGPDAALALAVKALPDATPTGISIPARHDRTIVVSLLAHGAVGANVYVDPWRAKVAAVRDPSAGMLAWDRPLHTGVGMGPVWRALVCLSGFVPALFVFTGVMMWLKKRRQRAAMSAPLAESLAEEVPG